MILHPPFIISARLLPGLALGDGFLSADGATFYLDTPEFEYIIDDFRPGASQNVQGWFASVISFMCAAVESRQYRLRQGKEFNPDAADSNETLFPPHVVDWIANFMDDLDVMGWDLEEGPQGLVEP